jgi:hypothetical protein
MLHVYITHKILMFKEAYSIIRNILPCDFLRKLNDMNGKNTNHEIRRQNENKSQKIACLQLDKICIGKRIRHDPLWHDGV